MSSKDLESRVSERDSTETPSIRNIGRCYDFRLLLYHEKKDTCDPLSPLHIPPQHMGTTNPQLFRGFRVLLGRGNDADSHAGNQRFRMTVTEHRMET